MALPVAAFGLASVLSVLVAGLHVFAGGPVVVPVLFEVLPERVAVLAYFTWHCGTASLLAMAAGFGWAAARPDGRSAGCLASLIAAGFGGLGLSIALFISPAAWQTPMPYAFWLIALVGGLAALTDRRTA
jgi:hypothetical protein